MATNTALSVSASAAGATPSSRGDLLLQHNCNYEQEEGMFRVYHMEVEWISFAVLKHQQSKQAATMPPPATGKPSQVIIPLQDLKEILVSNKAPKLQFRAQKQGVEMKYTFEYQTMAIRDATKDLVNRLFQQFRENAVPAQVRQKTNILANDAQLKKIYDELVGKGVISEKEFWQSRRELLVQESSRRDYQERGVQNDIFGELKRKLLALQRRDEASGKVKYTLDAQTIRDIFIAYPNIKRVYDLNVPHKITQDQFWVRFLKSQYFYRDRGTGIGTAGAPARKVTDDLFAEDKTEESDETIRQLFLQRSDRMDRFVNVAANEETATGYGLRPDELTAPTTVGGASDLLRRFNLDSARVLSGPSSATTNPAAAAAADGTGLKGRFPTDSLQDQDEDALTEEERAFRNHRVLEDLVAHVTDQLAPLNIQDKHRYFENFATDSADSQTSTAPVFSKSAMDGIDASSALAAFDSALSDLQSDFSDAFIDGALAMQIAADIDRMSLLGQGSSIYSAENKEVRNIPQDFQDKLDYHSQMLNELLRHFWSNVLGPKDTQKKVDKIMQSLLDYEQKMLDFQAEYQHNRDLTNVIKLQTQCITAAKERYEQRNAQAGVPILMPRAGGPATPMAPGAVGDGLSFSLAKKPAAGSVPSTPISAQAGASPTPVMFGLGTAAGAAKPGLAPMQPLRPGVPAAGVPRMAPMMLKPPAAAATSAPKKPPATIFGDDSDDEDSSEPPNKKSKT